MTILMELLALHPFFLYFFAALFFLCVGSLLNVIIYRLPQMIQSEWRTECRIHLGLPEEEESKINLFFPRSFCPACKTQIKAWQNIPVLSYLVMRGRCAACKSRIPLRYPLVELLTLFLSLMVLWQFGFTLTAVYALLFSWILVTLIFIDLDTQLLPDSLTLGLLWLGLLANTSGLFVPLANAVLSAALAYMALWLFTWIFYLVTGKIGMGNGDFKLFAAFGAWFGWQMLPLILLLSSFIGGIVGMIYLRFTHQGRNTPIPFGPYLCLAGFVTLFWGPAIVHWYLKFYGL